SLQVQNLALGCKDTIIKPVIVYPLPEVTAVGDTACYDDSVYLSVEDFEATNQYSWSPSTGVSNPNIFNPSALTLNDQVYTVTTTDTNGCVNVSSAMVVIIPPLS